MEAQLTPRPKNLLHRALKLEFELSQTEAAWKLYENELRALPARTLLKPVGELHTAVAMALGGVHNVLAQRENLDRVFRAVEWGKLEKVPGLALAAQHAEFVYRASQDEGAMFAELLDRMNELRGFFLDDLSAQVRRKRCPLRVLDTIRGGDNSIRDKANDLLDSALFYRQNWAELEGKTTVEKAEVDEAEALATKAFARLKRLQSMQQPTDGSPSPSELRNRAYTLLYEHYELVRKYGAFLFWALPDGWEAYVPPLWAGQKLSPERTMFEGSDEES